MPVTSQVDDRGIAEVVMDCPPVNALKVSEWFDVADRLNGLGRDPEVRVVMALEASEDPFTREIFARNMARNTQIYVEALQGLPDPLAREVVSVAASVFDLQLRQWVVGAQSIADVYDRIERAVWVLLEFSERLPADQFSVA